MSKNKISTLEGFVDTGIRASGRTTKLVDKAINIIFNGNICIVKDHHDIIDSHKELFDLISLRLSFEHNCQRYIEDWRFDINKLEIEYLK